MSRNLLLFLVFSFLGLLLVYYFQVNDYYLSWLYCITAVWSMKIIWDATGKRPTIFFFFMLSYHLFIGARFFVYIFSQENEIFKLDWFYPYNPTGAERLPIFLFVYLFQVMFTLGYSGGWRKKSKVRFEITCNNNLRIKIDKILNKAFPYIFVILIIYLVKGLLNVMLAGYGFEGRSENTEDVSYLMKFIEMAATVFTAMAVAYGKDSTKNKYYILLSVRAVVSILAGSRAAFGALLFFLVWAYSLHHKISIGKLAIYSFAGLSAMLFLFSFSLRAVSNGFIDLSVTDAFLDFFYSNGGSLAIFGASMTISDYPIVPYFQTLITGAGFIYGHLRGTPLKPEEATFQGHMCNTFDSELYYSGKGLGWTGNGDIYLFSGGNILIYCILCVLIARLLAYIDKSSFKSDFYKYMAGSLAFGLFMIPRGTFASLFAMIPYVYFYLIVIVLIANSMSRKRKHIKTTDMKVPESN